MKNQRAKSQSYSEYIEMAPDRFNALKFLFIVLLSNPAWDGPTWEQLAASGPAGPAWLAPPQLDSR